MNPQQMKQAWQEGKRTYGTMIASPSASLAKEVYKTGVDFAFIDTEHIALDRTQAAWMCQAYKAQGVAPIVRVTRPDPYEACTMLDGGAQGIVVPYTETVEQVKAMRGAVKYRPLKGQKLQRFLDGEEQLSQKEIDYLKGYNGWPLFILNIESRAAIDNLDALLGVPDVDAVFIGPHDLSINLGCPEEYTSPLFCGAVDEIIRKCLEKGIAVGNHFNYDIERQLAWAKQGMNIVVWNADIIRAVQALSADFAYLKKELGDEAGAVEEASAI